MKLKTLILIYLVVVATATNAHAWSFITNTLSPPFNQCATCHTSNSDMTMNPYGDDYMDPSHTSKYANRHPSPIALPGDGNCNNCHNGKGYPIKTSSLEDLDSDGDLYTNAAEIDAGNFPGDATDFPADIEAPTVTVFILPDTSDRLTIDIIGFTASDNIGITGYLITETSTAPAAGDAGWSASAPTQYTVSTAAEHILYAWAKDDAGNVSASLSATIDTTPAAVSPNEPPMADAGHDQYVTEGDTITLSGVGSTDGAYTWVQLDRDGGSALPSDDPLAVVLSDVSSITPYFITPPVGVDGAALTFRLIVTDNNNAQATAEVIVTISDNGISEYDRISGAVSTMTNSGDPIAFGATGANACIQFNTLDLANMPLSSTQPATMLYGIVDFELIANDPATSFTIYFPTPVPEGYKWYKYTEAKGWFDFDRDLISNGTGEGAVFNNDRTQITLYINDNSEHDDDPTVGIVRDSGGLSIGMSAVSYNDGSNSFGGSGGGCLINSIIK